MKLSAHRAGALYESSSQTCWLEERVSLWCRWRVLRKRSSSNGTEGLDTKFFALIIWSFRVLLAVESRDFVELPTSGGSFPVVRAGPCNTDRHTFLEDRIRRNPLFLAE